jgi:sugar lactone lactonase YvrE
MFRQLRFFIYALLIFSLFSTALLARGPQTPVRQEAGHRRPYKPRRGRDYSLAARERAKKEPARVSQLIHAEAPLSLAAQSADPSRDQDLPRLLPGLEREGERFDQPAEAAEFFWKKRVPVGETELPVERYFVARETVRRMPRYSTAGERPSRPGAQRKMSGAERELPVAEREIKAAGAELAAWTSLGPGNIGGRTRAILIDPHAPQVIYAAGVAGGVWKTTNGGESWAPITDLIANIAVNSLAMDPKNSKVIYAGTGEGYFAIDNVRGAGIFKTEDAGATWKRLESTANNANFHYVNDLVISSSDSRRMYAATRTGVWQTLDGGESWARVLNPRASFGSGTVTGGCLDLAIRTDLPADYVFASCGTFEQSTVYLNKDAAGAVSTWTSVLTETGMGRTSLAIAPSDQKVIYAVASAYQDSDYPDALYAVFRSASGGESGSWTAQVRNSDANKLNTSILSSPRFALATSCGIDLSDDYFGQGWYDNVVAVDPLDANRVWVGGIDLFRSDDGGANWGIASNAYIEQKFLVHPDHHAIVFHPKYDGAGNQIMYVGNDGGVYRTDNARGGVATGAKAACSNEVIGVNWVSLNNDYGVTQFYHGSPYPDGRSYLGGTQDNGTLRGTDEEGTNSWRLINGGDGGYVAVDQRRPNVLYSEFTGITIRKSTDAGKSFSSAVFGIADGGSFINPYVMDPSESQRLYTGGDYLWRTSNGASNWSRASALTAGVGKVTAIAVSPTDSNYALAGMSDGYLLLTNVALISGPQTVWNGSRPRGGYVSSVAFDPTNREIVYATYSTFGGAHVWRSVDGGANWSALDGSGVGALPDLPVHSIVIDPGNTSRLYIGTDLGVFVSQNGGASWAVENTGFANVVTEALAVNVNDGVTTLFAFTHGRGAWRVTLNNTGCNFSVSPATVRARAEESTGAIEVSAQPAGCEWRASSNADWISVEGSGSGNGRLNYRISANRGLAARAGTVTVAGRSLAIIQEGQVDATGPVIEITEKQVVDGLLRLAGTARDEGTIVQVSWTNDRGQSGVASGTERWTITDLPLAGGINQITINARDESGNVGRTMITLSARVSSYLATVAGTGRYGYSGENGPAGAADLTRPIRLAVDRTGNVYFTDSDNYRIRKVDLTGKITTVVGTGTRGFSGDQGPAPEAQLDFPIGVALDSQNNLYILDSGNRRVRKVSAATGVITTVAGNGSTGSAGDNGPAISAQLNNPQNVAVDASGNLSISDFGNQRIRKVTAGTGIITTVAGNGTRGFGGDGGPAVNAMLSDPNNVSVDAAGNLYLTDAGNSRIRRVASDSGIITTIVGNGEAGFSGDGGPALAARLLSPVGAIVDGAGNLYFSDRGNHRVRKVDVNGVISTIAGNGRAVFNGDGLLAVGSQLNAPTGLDFDLNGALLIGDRDNYRIRRLVSGAAGDVTAPVVNITAPTTEPQFNTAQSTLELKGTANDASELIEVRWANDRGGSGPAIGRAEWSASGIPLLIGANRITISALDAAGNVGFKSLIANYNPSRIILTAVGKGTAGGAGDGRSSAASELWLPGDVAIDRQGHLYIADTGNHRIRKVTREGAIEAFAGSGELGSSGDGGPAREAAMNMPCAVTVDAAGNVYIADTLNHRVRKVTVDGKILTVAGTGVDISAETAGRPSPPSSTIRSASPSIEPGTCSSPMPTTTACAASMRDRASSRQSPATGRSEMPGTAARPLPLSSISRPASPSMTRTIFTFRTSVISACAGSAMA